jgi:hypothetical protein
MRRHRLRSVVVALVAALVVAGSTGIAGAQVTPTTTPPPTTAPPATTVPTTPGSTLAPPTTAPQSPSTNAPVTTAPASDDGDGGSDIPWVPIGIGVLLLLLLIAVVAMLARRRGAARQAVTDWRHEAADTTAEAGATARLLSQGTPPSGQIAQQLLTSLRAFEDLGRAAPDDATAALAERARRAIQMLGLAIDSDYRVRRAQPPADPQQLERSQLSVQNAAGETDRTLRSVYRTLTGTS